MGLEGDSKNLDPSVLKVAAVVFLGPFMTQLDSTVVNVALSTIREDFHSTITMTHWIISSYLLALALMLPLTGWLVDRIGAKRLYIGCFLAFTLASMLCGAARTMPELICARIVQGMAGGLLAPMTQMMIARVAGNQMARVMGYTATPILLAPILGPVIAGEILRHATWPWIFYLNLPIGILAVVLAIFLLPSDKASIRKRPFDFLSFLLLSPGLAILLYGFDLATHQNEILTLLIGVILTAMFIWHALRMKNKALIDLRLFKNPIFSQATITQFLANGQTFAGQFLIPLFLIIGCKMPVTKTGWMFAFMGLGMMCSFPLMGYMTEQFGYRVVSSCGALLALLGTLPFLWMTQYHFSSALVMVSLFLRGLGQGAIMIPSVSAAFTAIPKNKLAVGATAMNIVQRLGGPFEVTLVAITMSLSAIYFPASGANAFLIPFVLLVGLHIFALGASSRLPR